MLSGSGDWGWGWSVYGTEGECSGLCGCCGGADCWYGGLSERGSCSGGVRWDGSWCVSSGLHGAVHYDDVCHGESSSCVCACLHLG